MSSNVFVGDHILMDVCLDSATRQLALLAGDGVLLSASEYAYDIGITGLMETAGLASGMSRLAGVQRGDPTETEGCARLWPRREAIRPDGTLFPALDADLTLSAAGGDHHGAHAASLPSPSTSLSPGSLVLSCIPLDQRFRPPGPPP